MTTHHPPLRPFGRPDVLAPTGKEASDFDRHAIDEVGVPQPVLMENAGRSAALVLQRLFPEGSVVGVVGAGNNGGDALVLLRTLAAWGREVHAIPVADRDAPESVLHGWKVPITLDVDLGDDPEAWRALLSEAVVVDGVLGTGVQGAPRARQAHAIRMMNACGRPTVAIDIPSGVDGATGAVPGEAVRADVTVAFGAPKLGSLLHPGRAHTGRLIAVEIAFPPMGEPSGASEGDSAKSGGTFARVATPAWAQAHLPSRELDTHKNAVGRLLVVAGRPGMAGAAVMAARAAFRAGAGLVQVSSAPENRAVLQGAVPEAIFVDPDDRAAMDDALAQAHAVAVGPGLGTDERAIAALKRVLDAPADGGGNAPLVLDADALNLLAGGTPEHVEDVAARRPLLVTPHAGEMSRLRRLDADDIAADRVGVVREAVETFGCAVLLKGAPSLVGGPKDDVVIDTQGSSDLAVAGMGDVLTGVCGALLAQGLQPMESGAVGLYLTGRAARLAGKGAGLAPTDVLRWLPEALAERGAGSSDLALPFILLDLDAAR